MWGLQLAKNYINWVERRKVMATLVVEEWCKGTTLDTTIYKGILHNNIHYNNEVEGLVISFMMWGLICLSFLRF